MMQASQSRDRNDSAIGCWILFGLASGRSFFAEAEVGAVLVIVGDVSFHESLQMALVHHKHMAQQVPAAIADEALRDSVLSRTLKARSLGLNTKALDRINHIVIEARAAIEDQIARRGVVRKRFPQLLDYPRARRLPGHVEVKNTPAFMRDHEEAVKHAECDGRHGEEIHCGDRFTVVAQECCPTSRRLGIPGRLSHPAQDTSLGDFVSEHLQLAVDTRRTPGVVLHYHAKDEFAQRLRCRFPAGSGVSTRDPFPIQLESGAMPANHGLGMHNDKNTSPIGPESPQDDPEQTVMDSQPGPRLPRRQRRKLLTECKVLQYQLAARSNTANQGLENGPQHFRHEWVISLKT